jgi:Xaa-Pro aminopeptidase
VPAHTLSPRALKRLRGEVAEAGCAGLVILGESAADPDLTAFVGDVHLGRSMVLVPADPGAGGPFLAYWSPMERDQAAAAGLALLTPDDLAVGELRDVPEAAERLTRVLARALGALGWSPGRVALAGNGPAGEVVAATARLAEEAGVRWVAGDDFSRRFRKTKSPRDLEHVRDAARGLEAAFRRVAGLLAAAAGALPGDASGDELWAGGERLRVGRLRAEVARVFADHGLEQPAGNLIAPAEEGAVPHNTGTDERVLRAGESLVVDLFPRGVRWGDCTRTFCVGAPPEALARAHGYVREALAAAHRSLVPGVRGWTLQEETCRILGGAGYPTLVGDPDATTGYVHNLGHGVGFELHEYPSFRKTAGAEGVIEEGDVLTLEPGLYDEAAGYGVRLEDLVALTPDGIENLTPWPYDLDPRAWGETT